MSWLFCSLLLFSSSLVAFLFELVIFHLCILWFLCLCSVFIYYRFSLFLSLHWDLQHFIDTTLYFKLIILISSKTFSSLPLLWLMFWCHNLHILYCFSIYKYCSYTYFNTFVFNLYTRVKWITHRHITVLEYSKFNFILTATIVLCIFMWFYVISILSFLLEEFLSALLVRQV